MDFVLVYVTASSADEAGRISEALVAERLAACVNLIPQMQSIYRWQGKLCHETEVVLLAKTRAALVPALTERVKALHSYTCPCIVALPLTGGNPDFLAWLAAETRE